MKRFALAAALAGLACAFLGAMTETQELKIQKVERRAFRVIGFSGRTTNASEATGNGIIGRFWERIKSPGVLDQIPDRLDSAILAVYSQYESDEKGAYAYLLGARVKPSAKVPEGMAEIEVPAGPYAVVQTPRGPVMKVVPETWRRIWNATPEMLGGPRAFRIDYEVYDERAADPKNAEVEIDLGVNRPPAH